MVGAFAASRRTLGRPAMLWAGLLSCRVKRGGFSMEGLMAKKEPGRSRPRTEPGKLRLTRRPVADLTEEQMDDAVGGTSALRKRPPAPRPAGTSTPAPTSTPAAARIPASTRCARAAGPTLLTVARPIASSVADHASTNHARSCRPRAFSNSGLPPTVRKPARGLAGKPGRAPPRREGRRAPVPHGTPPGLRRLPLRENGGFTVVVRRLDGAGRRVRRRGRHSAYTP